MSKIDLTNLFPGANVSGLIAPSTPNGDGVVHSSQNDEPEIPADPFDDAVKDAIFYLQECMEDSELSYMSLSFILCVRNQITKTQAGEAINEARKQIAAF
jgi:hypothetical protein